MKINNNVCLDCKSKNIIYDVQKLLKTVVWYLLT